MRMIFSSLFVVFATSTCLAADLPLVTEVEHQPLVAATERLLEALEFVGAPLPAEDTNALRGALKETDAKVANRTIQRVLDAHCVVGVTINPESRVSVVEGPVAKRLIQGGWATFLIKVQNDAGITPQLKPESPNAAPLYQRGTGARQAPLTTEKDKLVKPEDVPHRFLDIAMFDKQPLKPQLSGLALEYRIIQLYSRETGRREAKLGFNVGQGTQDLGFRNTVPILFNAAPSVEVVLGVKDFDGEPTSAAFVIRDRRGNVFPNPARRLSPDFFFHNQIYRADGESVSLAPGEYTVEVSRGPEYVVQTLPLVVGSRNRQISDGAGKTSSKFNAPNSNESGYKDGYTSQKFDVKLTRWTHPATRGWFSGDHHVHAAGCAHYDSPTEGVTPADMLRHILGEDLNVGCVLSWGPCWYSQKQYFEGKTSALSRPNYLMRYDIEVSGFPSSHAGHLCLLRLTEDDYPNTKVLEDWPSWTLPVLKWGKEQGGVVGYSHSGWGLELPDVMPDGSREFVPKQRDAGWPGKDTNKLPDYAMPRFDGIGANEYVVTVAHDVCHFISAVDTPSIWELNVWYHTLNAGFRAKISGETDFPCIYGDKVGLGRIYVKLNKDQPLDFDNWILGVRDGRSYCGDGLSHILDFKASEAANAKNEVALGEAGPTKKLSTIELAKPGKVNLNFDISALLAEKPNDQTESIRKRRLDAKPYWHIERCREGDGRSVPVDVIVNGKVAAGFDLVADGKTSSRTLQIDIKQSSWVAVRILPSVHTNPIWVEVGGQPVRASKKSIDWCKQAVEVCWNAKKNNIREPEREAAKAAYDEAAKIYEARLKEAVAD